MIQTLFFEILLLVFGFADGSLDTFSYQIITEGTIITVTAEQDGWNYNLSMEAVGENSPDQEIEVLFIDNALYRLIMPDITSEGIEIDLAPYFTMLDFNFSENPQVLPSADGSSQLLFYQADGNIYITSDTSDIVLIFNEQYRRK